MRWPPWRRRTPSTETLAARRRLDAVTRDDRQVRDVTEAMRELRRRNRLAELVTDALKGAP